MQNPGWRYIALLGMAGLAGVLVGCAEPSTSAGDPSTSRSSETVVNTLDWEMQWAQAALERNPNLEIITADRDLRTFVVRDRHNTLTTEVQLAQIAATPIEFLSAPAPSSAKPEAVAPTEPAAVTRLAQNPDESPDESADAGANEPESPAATAAVEPKSSSYTIDRSAGRTRVTGNGISVQYGDTHTRGARAPVSTTGASSPYSVDRSSGLVRINGPGVSIEGSSEPRAVAFGQSLDNAEIEPVICEGPRVMQLDNRVINVKGDALTARGGCELYITNSTIVASGTGVVIADAIVHINNSRIEGGLAPFEANERAKVFLRGSTLNGLPRRSGQALIQDQGGNRYQ
jgi:cytoskeletal protein RodZ